jgi:hypothetical protein
MDQQDINECVNVPHAVVVPEYQSRLGDTTIQGRLGEMVFFSIWPLDDGLEPLAEQTEDSDVGRVTDEAQVDVPTTHSPSPYKQPSLPFRC